VWFEPVTPVFEDLRHDTSRVCFYIFIALSVLYALYDIYGRVSFFLYAASSQLVAVILLYTCDTTASSAAAYWLQIEFDEFVQHFSYYRRVRLAFN
jgi:hypothetical protein